MNLTIVEDQDGQLGLYAGDTLVVETDDGIVIEIAEKLHELGDGGYAYIKHAARTIDPFPERMADILMLDADD